MSKEYLPRLFDKILEFSLKSIGAILVVGPKWCGKSTTSSRYAKTIIDLTDEQTKEQYISLAKNSPIFFLSQGERPLLIDEWQEISFIWNNIKKAVDESQSFGQFILTGSVTDKTAHNENSSSRHTGTGRIVRKIMRPMSLYESGDSSGDISLLDLKENKFKPCLCNKNIDDYAFYICRGGWPVSIRKEEQVALQQAINFYDAVVNIDLFSLKDINIRKDVSTAKKFMRSYSRNIGSQCSDTILINDVGFDTKTFEKYKIALEQLYVIEELECWNPNLRSKVAIRSKNTRHFIDPSIAVASLGLSPKGLFFDMRTFGFLFESLAIRDLRVYCDSIGASIYHYRDQLDREADAVIQFKDGTWALIEVKLGNQEDIDLAAKKLKSLSRDIDVEKTGKPAFLMVITKGFAAIKRDDGVYEIPLACLKN